MGTTMNRKKLRLRTFVNYKNTSSSPHSRQVWAVFRDNHEQWFELRNFIVLNELFAEKEPSRTGESGP